MVGAATATGSIAPITWDDRLVGDVLRDLNACLKADGVEFGENDFTDMTASFSADGRQMPNCRWLVCFPVRGGNEGWYIHVEAIIDRPDRSRVNRLLGLAKTWSVESAWAITQAAARHLNIV